MKYSLIPRAILRNLRLYQGNSRCLLYVLQCAVDYPCRWLMIKLGNKMI